MEIPRTLLDEYTAQLNALSTAGQQLVLNALQNAEWKSIAELRSLMVVVMDEVCSVLASDAAVVASDMYDDVREMSVGKRFGYIAPSAFDGAATEGAVRALVQSVVTTGTTNAFGRTLQERVDYEVKRAAGECVKANAARDPLKPKWARIPAGSETCGFCLMLASRGFVYASDKVAGSDGHYHPNCDCRIVPGFDGMAVEGYDPGSLYSQWKGSVHADYMRRRAEDGQAKRKRVSSYRFDGREVLPAFKNFADVKDYIYSASDQEDLEHRFSVLGVIYGMGSDQMRSQAVKNAVRHTQKRL